ncbi:hypothetical protein F5Y13DRAFT_188745 [Hypoxylon sp. FL1857]|nr:hypothetical protein F5Y13DRAFT_188745 [Hypoxylon sp. FL1857]
MGNRLSITTVALFSSQVILWAQAIPPPGHDTPRCSATSEAPNTFNVQNIKYQLRNPPIIGRLQLDVTNRATNVMTHCDIAGPQLTPGLYGKDNPKNLRTSCDETTEPPEGSERYYTVDPNVVFDRNSTWLAIN